MLSLYLQPIFKARGIEKPFSFLVKAGFNYNAAHRLTNGKPSVLKLDHIELLCKVLVCDPNDLLKWTPNKDEDLSESHPLRSLLNVEKLNELNDLIKSTPYKELKNLNRNFKNN